MIGDLDDDVVVRDQSLVLDAEAVVAGGRPALVAAVAAGRALRGTTRHALGRGEPGGDGPGAVRDPGDDQGAARVGVPEALTAQRQGEQSAGAGAAGERHGVRAGAGGQSAGVRLDPHAVRPLQQGDEADGRAAGRGEGGGRAPRGGRAPPVEAARVAAGPA